MTNSILIISKPNCGPCIALKNYIETLSEKCKHHISILDDKTSTMEELHSILDSYGSYGFPTLILQSQGGDRVVTGFGSQTKDIIKNHLEC